MTITDALCESQFLREIPHELLVSLSEIGQSRVYQAGDVLFAEGKRNPDFHIILTGQVRLEMFVPRRGSIPILTVGPGEMLAWSAVVGNTTMTSSGVALEQATTISFSGVELQKLCESDHQLGYHIFRRLSSALSRRLFATRLQLLDLFHEHIPINPGLPGNSDSVDAEC